MKSPRNKRWFLQAGHSTMGCEGLMQLLSEWRKTIGYYSILAAVPALIAGSSQDVRADDAAANSPPAPPETGIRRQAAGREFLKARPPRHSGNLLLAGQIPNNSDDCPGTSIPAGVYTAGSPYIDTGDTTGANDTVRFLYTYYFDYNAFGPDRIYSFDVNSVGPYAHIRVTTSSPTYRPMIYVTGGCPAGVGNESYDWYAVYDSRWGSDNTANVNVNYLGPGHYYLFVDSSVAGDEGPYTLTLEDVRVGGATTAVLTNRPDFDGDGKTDLSVFRPSQGNWYLYQSAAGVGIANWGIATDIPVPADYDHDGKTDIAVFRPSDGNWYVYRSSDGAVSVFHWGIWADVPVPGDYDGDGKADFAVYRPSDGKWYLKQSAAGATTTSWGQGIDLPVQGDYDGDGKTDIAVFRPSDGNWYLLRSTAGITIANWGNAADKPVPADYDGDQKQDVAVYRPSTGVWYIYQSTNGAAGVAQWGNSTDVPVPGDYDGDGKTDYAIYRNGTWYLYQSTAGIVIANWGTAGDVPIPAAYIP